MAWVEAHADMARHPKVFRFGRFLRRTHVESIGWLLMFWHWALDNAPDGELCPEGWDGGLRECDFNVLENGVGWDGEPGTFVQSLVRAGLVDGDQWQGFRIHDWMDYTGKQVVRRRQNAERTKANRGELRASVIARDGYVCGICGGDVEAGDVHLDHIRPVSKGGPTTFDNLRVTHSFCNISRGNRDWSG